MKIKTRTRQLCNGKWVGEVKAGWIGKWRAIDCTYSESVARSPGNEYYARCFYKEQLGAETAIVQHLSQMGVGISQYPHPKQ